MPTQALDINMDQDSLPNGEGESNAAYLSSKTFLKLWMRKSFPAPTELTGIESFDLLRILRIFAYHSLVCHILKLARFLTSKS